MAPTYYVIELSARWLTILLVALALVMVLAFAFGYGAAWSVLASKQQVASGPAAGVEGSSVVMDGEILDEEIIEAVPTERPVQSARPTPRPTATPRPRPTAVPPTPVPEPKEEGFWVQVLASSTPQAMERAANKLADLGFPTDHQRVTTTQVAGGNVLYKLRVGPFPDRESADRVARRMQTSGFPDAWIVSP